MVGQDFLKGIEVEETSEYGEQVTSIKQICLEHVKKISNMICQELTPGYWETKPIKVASGVVMSKTYKPDLRIGYCNAIEFLADLVYPFSDKIFKEYMNEIYDAEETDEPEIVKRIKIRRKMFRQMAIMFERDNFFDSSNAVSE